MQEGKGRKIMRAVAILLCIGLVALLGLFANAASGQSGILPGLWENTP
jgi:hypothetical protein